MAAKKRMQQNELFDVGEIAQNLSDVSNLLEQQVKANLPRGETLVALFGSYKYQLEQLHSLSQQQVHRLTEAINEGPWENEQSKMLAKVVASGQARSGPLETKASAKFSRRSQQNAKNPENLIPESLWIDLGDSHKYNWKSRCHLVARLFAMLGVCNPSQRMLYRLVQIIAYKAMKIDITQNEVWDHMDSLQDFMKGYHMPKDLPYIENFEPSANALPDVLKTRAYGDGPLPVEVHIPELDAILGNHKMRGRPRETKWLTHVPPEMQKELLERHPELLSGKRRRGKQHPIVLPLVDKGEPQGAVLGSMLATKKFGSTVPESPTPLPVQPAFGKLGPTYEPA